MATTGNPQGSCQSGGRSPWTQGWSDQNFFNMLMATYLVLALCTATAAFLNSGYKLAAYKGLISDEMHFISLCKKFVQNNGRMVKTLPSIKQKFVNLF